VFENSLNIVKAALPSINGRTLLIPYYPGLGNGYSVKKMDISKGKSSLQVRWKMWLEDIKKKDEKIEIKSIVGEFSNFEYERMILDDTEYLKRCESLEIIFGDKMNPLTKAEIINKNYLPESGKGKLILHQFSQRPRSHKTMINNKIFYEDEHETGVDFKNFVVYENIPSEHRDRFLADFTAMKKDSTPIYTKSDLIASVGD